MDKFRIGLIGYGRFGQLHKDAIAQISNCEVTCVCVGSKETQAKLQAELKIPVYTDYEEFLSREEIDIVDIVSPNYLHARQAIAAMNKGKDVLLEKPIATNIEDARRILSVKERTSSRVQVGFEYRYAPFWSTFKSALEKGLVADVKFARIESWRNPFRLGSGGWRYDNGKVGHQLLEEAIHYFDLAAWYFGMPDRVSGFTDSPTTWTKGEFSTAVVFLDYPQGPRVIISDTLNGIGGQNIVSMNGSGGAIFGILHSGVDTLEDVAWVRMREKGGTYSARQVDVLDEAENLRLLIQDFVTRLNKNEEPSVSLLDGFKALELDLMAISAVGSNAVETLKP
jgi:myo-inositol 2-dehydrogenase/D-chiro-inositol 1-dehydrogenase